MNGIAPGRLRVLTFSSLFPNAEQPLHGAFVERRVRAVARLCDVRVVAPVPRGADAPGVPERFRRYARVPVAERRHGLTIDHPRFVVLPRVGKSMDGRLMAMACSGGVRRIHRAWPFDVVDAHWGYPDGAAALSIARSLGVPVAVTVRGDDVNVFGREPGRGRVVRQTLLDADRVIALSNALRDAVLDLTDGRTSVAVIPNGVDSSSFRPADRAEARRQLRLPPGDPIVISVGRLHQSKGFATLVDAAGRLSTRYPSLRVVILGDPDGEDDATPSILAARDRWSLGDRLLLPGAQPHETLPTWLSAANLFALPTAREGSPNVVLEALACGLPCVTTPVGGIPDVLNDPRLGLLVPPTVEGFVDGLVEALERSWDTAEVVARGARRSWDDVAAECHAELLSIAPRASRATASGRQGAA